MIAVPGQVVYAGTKFAVVGLSAALADEFAPQGVEVSVIMPTFTNTELITGTHASAAQKPVRARGHRRGGGQGARQAEDASCRCRR